MKRSGKTKTNDKVQHSMNSGRAVKAKAGRRKASTAGDAAPLVEPKFRIEKCLRDSCGFPHIEQGCRDRFSRMVENYQQWATRYVHAVRLALLIPGIENYEPC